MRTLHFHIALIAFAIALSGCVNFRTEEQKEAYALKKFMHYMDEHNFEIARNFIASGSKDNFDSFISDFTCDRNGNLPELLISIVKAETDNYFILNMSKVGEPNKCFVFTGFFEDRYVCFTSNSHGQGTIGSFTFAASPNQKVNLYDDENGVCIASVDPSQEAINYILKYKGKKRSMIAMQTYNDGTYYKYYKNFWVDNSYIITDSKHKVKHTMEKELPNEFLAMEGLMYHYYYYFIVCVIWFLIVFFTLFLGGDEEGALIIGFFAIFIIPALGIGHIVRLVNGTLTSVVYDFTHYLNIPVLIISGVLFALLGIAWWLQRKKYQK